MKHLYNFLNSQRLLVLATSDKTPWVTNVFYSIGEDLKIYFISNEETLHSRHLLENPNVAFSVAWYNPQNHIDRKGVQGTGTCNIITSDEDIATGVKLHNTHFPEFADRITVDWVKSDENKSHLWIIEPEYIKFWNDELYGDDEYEEFNF